MTRLLVWLLPFVIAVGAVSLAIHLAYAFPPPSRHPSVVLFYAMTNALVSLGVGCMLGLLLCILPRVRQT